jgi:hypothetical protein
MNLAISLVGAALAYLFIVGLALVWNRGANCSSTPKPGSFTEAIDIEGLERVLRDTSKDRSSSPIDSPYSTRLQGDRVAQEVHER